MFKRLICKIKGHKWQFAYNHGIPLGCKEPWEVTKQKFDSGEYFPVNRCTRCGDYDHPSDGLNPYVKEGFAE